MPDKQTTALYMRNFIFGVEDSLVSTVGLLSGIAVGGVDRPTILLTGIILIFVEAFSMGVGSFLSEYPTEEFARAKKIFNNSVNGALVMFVSYILAGLIPILPYVLIQGGLAVKVSVLVSLAALGLLGWISARMLKINVFKNSLRMFIIGGAAVLVGIVIARIIS
jgi:VIT1/CCC1 family predicted Fe2+/Mn2+ transporter